jgi:hypothetical protein
MSAIKLYPYQEAGVKWLVEGKKHKLLADDKVWVWARRCSISVRRMP